MQATPKEVCKKNTSDRQKGKIDPVFSENKRNLFKPKTSVGIQKNGFTHTNIRKTPFYIPKFHHYYHLNSLSSYSPIQPASGLDKKKLLLAFRPAE
jgi:hypothetical protein